MKDRLRFFKEMLSTAVSLSSCALVRLDEDHVGSPLTGSSRRRFPRGLYAFLPQLFSC